MIKGIRPMIDIKSFNPHVKEHGKSVFLGYMTLILTYKGVCGDGSDMRIVLRSLEVKLLTEESIPHFNYAENFDEKSRKWVPRYNGELPRFVHQGIEADRQLITDAIFANPWVVKSILQSAEQLIA